MADVTFRRGVEANLPTSGMATEGCVYQSTDTGNMYVGSSQGTLIPVNRSPYYGTCPTQAGTNSKVVILDVDDDNFTMKAGVMISVLFSNANTAASPTLNVNNKGAVAVKLYGTTNVSASPRSWEAGEVVTFVHNGSYWMMVGHKTQSDWNQTDTAAKDFIKNKPTDVSSFNNDAGYITSSDIPKSDVYHAGDNISIEESIPYGYTPLEYVYNSSNTYQNTGIRPTVDDVELEFEYRDSNTGTYACLFGNMPTSSSDSHYGLGYFSSADIKLYTKGTVINSGVSKVSGHGFYIKGVLKNGNGSIYVKDLTNGTEGEGSGTYTFSETSYNIEIFRRRHNTTYMPSGARVCKAVIKIKGETVLNYIPAKRNSDNVCGFWDTVTKTFVTATAGQWNAGSVSSWEKHFTISAINIPTSTSELTNDSGFVTSADLPTKTSDLTNDGSDGTSTYVESDELATVATSGLYSDLSGTPTYALGETTGGPASLTVGLPYGTIDATSTGTLMTATVNGITELRDGVTCIIVNNVVGSESGYTLNVNNLGAKPVYYFYDGTTQSATAFTVGRTEMFVYDSTKVSGGCWNMVYPFSPDQTSDTYRLRHYYSTKPVATALGRYRILFSSADGTKYVPANSSSSTSATTSKTVTTEKIDPFGEILVYNSTTTRTANQTPAASVLFSQMRITIGYSFNRTGAASTLTTNVPVYIKCTPQTDGSAIIDPDTPYVQALPSTEDGKIYIFLGIASSATYVEVLYTHPVYQYKGSKIIQYLPSDSNLVHKTGAETVGGEKTFTDNLKIVSGNVIDLGVGNDEGVYIQALSDIYGKKIAFGDDDDDTEVRLVNVAAPIDGLDVANKQYVDESKQQAVVLNGRSGIYGIPQKSLVACADSLNGMTWLMEPLATSGGTGNKTPNHTAKFPVGCSLYYYDSETPFASNSNFVGKMFYLSHGSVDARYTAIGGSSVSLSGSSTSEVFLRVNVDGGYWSPFFKSGDFTEIIVTSNQLQTGNWYMYLGKTQSSSTTLFQLENNHPLYWYDGEKMVPYAERITELTASYTAGNGISINGGEISISPDTALNANSTNAVTNAAVYAAIEKITPKAWRSEISLVGYFNSKKTVQVSSSSNPFSSKGTYKVSADFLFNGGINGTYGTGATQAYISLSAFKDGGSIATELKSARIRFGSYGSCTQYIHIEDYVYLSTGVLVPQLVIEPVDGYVSVEKAWYSGTDYNAVPTFAVEYLGDVTLNTATISIT